MADDKVKRALGLPRKKHETTSTAELSKYTELYQKMVFALEKGDTKTFKRLFDRALAEGYPVDYSPVEYKWARNLLWEALDKDRPIVQGSFFKPKKVNVVKLLLDSGADPNHITDGENALIYALQQNISDENLSRLAGLIKDINKACDKTNATAVDVVCTRIIQKAYMRDRFFNWLKILFAAGAEPTPTNKKYAEMANTKVQKRVVGELEQFLSDFRMLREEQEKQLNNMPTEVNSYLLDYEI